MEGFIIVMLFNFNGRASPETTLLKVIKESRSRRTVLPMNKNNTSYFKRNILYKNRYTDMQEQ